jgi:hypothetical protein
LPSYILLSTLSPVPRLICNNKAHKARIPQIHMHEPGKLE